MRSFVGITVALINSKPVVEKHRLKRKEDSQGVALSSISTTKETGSHLVGIYCNKELGLEFLTLCPLWSEPQRRQEATDSL